MASKQISRAVNITLFNGWVNINCLIHTQTLHAHVCFSWSGYLVHVLQNWRFCVDHTSLTHVEWIWRVFHYVLSSHTVLVLVLQLINWHFWLRLFVLCHKHSNSTYMHIIIWSIFAAANWPHRLSTWTHFAKIDNKLVSMPWETRIPPVYALTVPTLIPHAQKGCHRLRALACNHASKAVERKPARHGTNYPNLNVF